MSWDVGSVILAPRTQCCACSVSGGGRFVFFGHLSFQNRGSFQLLAIEKSSARWPSLSSQYPQISPARHIISKGIFHKVLCPSCFSATQVGFVAVPSRFIGKIRSLCRLMLQRASFLLFSRRNRGALMGCRPSQHSCGLRLRTGVGAEGSRVDATTNSGIGDESHSLTVQAISQYVYLGTCIL